MVHHFVNALTRRDTLRHMQPHHSIQRDVSDRGRDIAGVIEQYTKFVKPAFDAYVAPSRKHADVIIPWGRCVCLRARMFVKHAHCWRLRVQHMARPLHHATPPHTLASVWRSARRCAGTVGGSMHVCVCAAGRMESSHMQSSSECMHLPTTHPPHTHQR